MDSSGVSVSVSEGKKLNELLVAGIAVVVIANI